MRIDLYGAAAVSPERTGAGGSLATQPASEAIPVDKATLSSGSQLVPSLAVQALQAAEARYAKVDALNRAVSSGAYTLDPSIIAYAIASSGI